jgi:putative phage-type endonuclease
MEQRSAEWHLLRKSKIGASDAAPLMGVSPWKNSYDVWQEKCGTDIIEPAKNAWMQRGIDLEDEALRAFELATGLLVSPSVLFHSKYPWMMASLDGYEIEGKAAVEIKCPGVKDHEIAIAGIIPAKYYPQLQHQLAVTGLDKIYYMSYSPDHETPKVILEVKRDDEYISKLIEVEREFYYQHMLTGIPPENPDKTKVMDSYRWSNLVEEYKKFDFIEKDAAIRKEALKQQMIEESDSENARGNGITLTKVEKKGNINYQNIPMLKTMDLEEFRKPGTSYWQVKESNEN